VQFGSLRATIAGEVALAQATVRLGCSIELVPGAGATIVRKRYMLAGEPVRYVRYLGRARVVSFSPGDVAIAYGAPSVRRSFLNAALAQESVTYHAALIEYTRFLAQKNALLRGTVPWDAALLDVYDERLRTAGRGIIESRLRFTQALASPARDAYAEIAPTDPPFVIRYEPSAAADTLGEALAEHRAVERSRRRALVGPHRDELQLTLGEWPAGRFGSQAQVRGAVLALKLAELEVAAADGGDAPLALLDDVLSELDPLRQSALLRRLERLEQAFITTALEGSIGAEFRRGRRYEVEAGSLRAADGP